MTSPLISILIPTYKRPRELARLLDSLHRDLGARRDVVIIVADNDKTQSAETVVKSYAERSHQAVDYRVAPEPGVSNARNVAMDGVQSRYVLFLDDDMEVVPPYTQTLLDTAQELGSTLTFAPAIAQLPEGAAHLSEWLGPLFSRTRSGPTGIITKTFGTGGCLVDLDRMTLSDPIFDPELNETGGEDDEFFQGLIDQGGRVGWCAETKAWEHVPPHRANRAYLWSRHFAFGQAPSREAADDGLRGLPKVIMWMMVGGLQILINAPLYYFLRLTGHPKQISHLGRMAQGVGKVFWWDGFSPKLYGANAQ